MNEYELIAYLGRSLSADINASPAWDDELAKLQHSQIAAGASEAAAKRATEQIAFHVVRYVATGQAQLLPAATASSQVERVAKAMSELLEAIGQLGPDAQALLQLYLRLEGGTQGPPIWVTKARGIDEEARSMAYENLVPDLISILPVLQAAAAEAAAGVRRGRPQDVGSSFLLGHVLSSWRRATGSWPKTTKDAEGEIIAPILIGVRNLTLLASNDDRTLERRLTDARFRSVLRSLKAEERKQESYSA